MNPSNPFLAEITTVSFSFYTADQIREISVKKITAANAFDQLGHPQDGGLYDLALGPFDKKDMCNTCGLSYFACPGHFGHIELPLPVYNPITFPTMFRLLRSLCLYCFRLRTPTVVLHNLTTKLRLLLAGLPIEASDLDSYIDSRMSSFTTLDEGPEDGASGGEKKNAPRVSQDDILGWMDEYAELYLDQLAGKAHDQRKSTVSTGHFQTLLKAFFSTVLNTCPHCKAQSPSLRKEGYIKIFEKKLSDKVRRRNEGKGLTRTAGSTVGKSTPAGNPKASKGRTGGGPTPMEGVEAEESDDEVRAEEEDDDDDEDSPAAANAAVPITSVESGKDIYLTPIQVRMYLRNLWKHDRERSLLDLLYGSRLFEKNGSTQDRVSSPDIYFLEVVPVTPTRFRPPSKMNDVTYDNPQNGILSKIVKTCEVIITAHKSSTTPKVDAQGKPISQPGTPGIVATSSAILPNYINLQSVVNSLIDSTKAGNAAVGSKNTGVANGIRQILEKKEGLFRMHMMGKRVNYAGRSVISPDVNVETGEVGIPPFFATRMTYPAPVTAHNLSQLRQAVINGPHKWPGATHIVMEDGSLVSLAMLDEAGRTALANQLGVAGSGTGEHGPAGAALAAHTPKKVYRHLLNGDLLLMNRQPTLHKPSIMAHTARILPNEKTIRMHYANCNTYNADFDGDEMNVHFPQNELARAEAMVIARTEEQYLVPTSGGVLRGLIQDHVDAGVWMTNKDTWFTAEDYMQLCYVALRPDGGVGARGEGDGAVEKEWKVGGGKYGRIHLVEPAILKPRKMWSGKQVISTILLNLSVGLPQLSLISKSRVPSKYWGKTAQDEAMVIVQNGHLLTGILDKNQFGASANGLVHACYEVYGAKMAGKLLSVFSRLFSYYLQHDGFSCRMDDLLLTPEGNNLRKILFVEVEKKGLEVAKEFVGMTDKDGKPIGTYQSEEEEKAELRKRLEGVLRSDERMAALDGALKTKTNQVTSKVIGATVPDHLLRQFPHNNMQVMTVAGAKGSGVNVSQISCLLGQQELEGRRVPTMVSGKTLPSFQPFDTDPRAGGYVTGRFLSGIRPQEYFFHCMAGREGLIDTAVKTSRSGYLQRCLIKHLEGLRVHYDSTVRDSDGSVIQFLYGEDGLDVMKGKYLTNFGLWATNYEMLERRVKPAEILSKGIVNTDGEVEVYRKKALKKPLKYDTVMSQFWPTRYLGSTSEQFTKGMREYMDKDPDRLMDSKDSQLKFAALMDLKYITALAEPGEAVGLLAAQGVGEPSTQMTLNTFHLAGFGATNVTLGIPRLRELLMTASTKIKTPLMSLPLLSTTTDDEALEFCKQVSRLNLSHIVEDISVRETLSTKDLNSGIRHKVYVLRIGFWKRQDYAEEYDVSERLLERVLERKFVPGLEKVIAHDIKKKKSRRQSAETADDQEDQVGKPQRRSEGEGSGSNLSGEDGDGDVEDDSLPNPKKPRGKGTRDADDMDPDDEDEAAERDEEDAEGDGDASAAARNQKKKQMASYEEESEDDEEDERPKSGANFLDVEAEEDDGDGEDGDSDEDIEEGARKRIQSDEDENEERDESGQTTEQRILDKSSFVVKYRFDRVGGRWCELHLKLEAGNKKVLMVDLAEKVARKVVVREVRGINRIFVTHKEASDDKSRSLTSEGSNLRGMWSYPDILDLNQIYSNDIGEILKTYGVEAARAAVVREVGSVFGAYGISVDRRHLSLISDYMTFEGAYKPFNRMGMTSNPHPFAQMSFETTMQFLTTATLAGDKDDLTSPSSRIVMGQVVRNGTGAFDVRVPLDPTVHVPAKGTGKWDREKQREDLGRILREGLIRNVVEK
ncbi:beta and beta-prime subunits of DNA dependent RNA-polymerase [Gonapodya prolifera JEL478]|uniref:DNA-directed RNA polymerase subunit n=1 Tax=Gonapodya prolifera (strain JEL478) TaxID=1344416 RepID=A0A139APQ2_GONPJ|nr:beta and beta-prime subunits of DNA dependent RNA-polymerase [Gonapodya prolifera JEL478]|eukprot:KXS18698.1 beta and beta-prime subunits of DNA dependent RNA-polymerase [Gonapodya prolifera JEL478]